MTTAWKVSTSAWQGMAERTAGAETATVVAASTVVVATAVAYLLYVRRTTDKGSACWDQIPHVPSPLPFLGVGPSYFSGVFPFSMKFRDTFGATYAATVFGRRWLFLSHRQDVLSILKAPERHISMLKATFALAGFTFPQERMADYASKEISDKIAFRGGQGPSNTPAIIHSIRKEKRLAWLPAIRDVVQQAFAKLPDKGTVSLFDWCQSFITSITVRVLLGDVVTRDADLLDNFVALFREGDPEVGFGGPLKSFTTLLETFFYGERRVFCKVRALLYPHVDAEIQRICVDQAPEQDNESVLQTFVRRWYAKLNQDVRLVRIAKRRIVNELFLFTFAAFTNSYAGTAWVIYHVLKNTNGVGDKIRSELDTLQTELDKDDPSVFKAADINCPYLEWTILEISRLYTPGNLVRETLVPWKMPSTGLTIPSGTFLNFSVGLAHRDPASFPNPLKFHPERFDPAKKAENPGVLFSFGAGAHPCPGRKFAVYEMALFVVEALQNFDLTLEALPPTNAFTAEAMGPDHDCHPPLDPSQVGFIWRTAEPVMVSYRRK
jgi:cytochrome P450